MRILVRNIVLVAIVLLFAVYSIIPPEKKLRLGKDLRGGVSLIYAVHLRPGDPPDVMDSVMDVIRQRVDPNAQMDITIAKQGTDRLEITMPLPNESVKRLKAEFEAELKRLVDSAIDTSRFERLMRMPPAERDQEITKVAAGNATRADRLRAAATAYDAARKARGDLTAAQTELRQATEAGAPAEQVAAALARVNALVAPTAEAELAYESARTAAMGAAITVGEVRRALALSTEGRTFGTGPNPERSPSPRERALTRLNEAHPELKDELASVVAAYDRYTGGRTRLDDPADLKRLLAGAGVLDFRITVKPGGAGVKGGHPEEPRLRAEMRERGPRNVRSNDARWYKVNKLEGWYDRPSDLEDMSRNPAGYFESRYRLVAEEFDGEFYILCWDSVGNRLTQAEGDWAVAAAYQGTDDVGRPNITFEMNTRGASLLQQMTRAHVQENMAVLLDDQVYTAPNLLSAIGRNGQISGNFSPTELRYVIRVLAAGAMQAKLSPEPISESTIGPELGFDNLYRGMYAGVVSLILIGAFMIVYYFGAGVIAVISLMVNGLLLVAVMSWLHAAFTLPGIAGVILTFGMAVDSNVLIYERMREEIKRGSDLRTAVRLGFSKALSSIVDGNVTNLIACVVLLYVGTQEIKGFAITLGVGVLTTLFSALVVSRLIFSALVEHGPWQRASMLPLAFPVIDRMFNRNIDWLKFRWVFFGISAMYLSLGLGMVAYEGAELLDNEFRGGTQVTLKLKQPLTRPEAAKLVASAGAGAPQGSQLALLRTADVLPVNPAADGVTSDTFMIKTLATEQGPVLEAVMGAFAPYTEAQPALRFRGSDTRDLASAPVFRIVSGTLGDEIDRPQYREDVRPFVGGLAILLENIEPAVSAEALRARLEQTRSDAEFSATLTREWTVRILEGTDEAVRTAVVLVRDPSLSSFEDPGRFDTEVALREWRLIERALTEPGVPASVHNFSPTIAAAFKARAVVAIVLSFLFIGIYIWVRFGAVNFAVAGIVPLVHDVITALGFVALAQFLYNWHATHDFAVALRLLPFKIDLNMIAAFLTIVGYSLNDSIVVMDRIRENRGKLPYASRKAINDAVNQTLSRTFITGGGTLIALSMLYLFGGEAVRGFAFTLAIGVLVGTYSSIGITAPFVWSRKGDEMERNRPRPPAQPPAQMTASVS
ncbi:MAG: protein translocase subunit SecD [Phycisphaerales bacterium]